VELKITRLINYRKQDVVRSSETVFENSDVMRIEGNENSIIFVVSRMTVITIPCVSPKDICLIMSLRIRLK